ncbi:MAG: hypothetical protein MUC38_06365 [Cyclobacteriaceae bacterium]|jgi:hypothetical protein|nr:hypothetical protein [Cyclobacteriaceae bacterium]
MEKETATCNEIELAIAELAKLSPDQRTAILAGFTKMVASHRISFLTGEDDDISGWWRI